MAKQKYYAPNAGTYGRKRKPSVWDVIGGLCLMFVIFFAVAVAVLWNA